MEKQKLIFRADGNNQMGMGHIYRSLALVEILRNDFRTCFAIQLPDSQIATEISRTADELIALPASPGPAVHSELLPYLTGKEIVILDGYHFSSEYQRELKPQCKAIVCIDDIPDKHFSADIIINFCGAIHPSQYDREIYTQLFLGLDYLFLRSPFRDNKIKVRDFNEAIFINMGGSDPLNNTCKLVDHLLSLKYQGEIKIVIGNTFKFRDQLDKLIQRSTNITLYQGMSAAEMYEIMCSTCTAILPPSTIALEFLSIGGSIFLHQTATNQSCIKEYLLLQNIAFEYEKMGEFLEVGLLKSTFIQSLRKQQNILDGKSQERLLKIFNSLTWAGDIELHKASVKHKEITFQWANDPETRRFSYSVNPIRWEEHEKWYSQKISDSGSHYFILLIRDTPIGQIRFDQSGEEGMHTYIISYLLDKNWRGKGLGTYVLFKGIDALKQTVVARKVVGFVQKANASSVHIFKKCGFTQLDNSTIKYADSFKFELEI